MKKYEFNATNLIAKTFEEREVKFHVVNMHGHEEVLAGFHVDNGPKAIMKFISRDNDNDVAVRIFGLVNAPKEKRGRVMEACNMLNRKIRFMKFYVDTDGDINVEYDFPVHASDDCIGEMAFEIFVRTMQILDHEYELFNKALYTDEELKDDKDELSMSDELLRRLEELKNRLEARLQEHEDEQDEVVEASDTDCEEAADEDDDFMAFLSMLAGETSAEEVA